MAYAFEGLQSQILREMAVGAYPPPYVALLRTYLTPLSCFRPVMRCPYHCASYPRIHSCTHSLLSQPCLSLRTSPCNPQPSSSLPVDSLRMDGRAPLDLRPLHSEAGTVGRVHGAAMCGRGGTQVLATVTVGAWHACGCIWDDASLFGCIISWVVPLLIYYHSSTCLGKTAAMEDRAVCLRSMRNNG